MLDLTLRMTLRSVTLRSVTLGSDPTQYGAGLIS